MEYNIRFEIPNEVDALISDFRRKWVAEKLAEVLRELVAHEAVNGLDMAVLQINPVIEKTEAIDIGDGIGG